MGVCDARMACDPAAGDELVLVDEFDRQVGTASKLECHTKGLLHRAFSVVLVREGAKGWETLLARRAKGKYHSGGLWTNACCSHPRAGEDLAAAVARRLHEELGVEGVQCREVGCFVYRAPFANGITEYELDHVWLGFFDGAVVPDSTEVSEERWVSVDLLTEDLTKHPERYTVWCAEVFELAAQSLPC